VLFVFTFTACLDVVLIRHGTTLLSNARLYIELQLKNVHPYHFHLVVVLLISMLAVGSGESIEHVMLDT
jgi:hypothetical protein